MVIRGVRGACAILILLNALANRNMHLMGRPEWLPMTECPKMLVSVKRGAPSLFGDSAVLGQSINLKCLIHNDQEFLEILMPRKVSEMVGNRYLLIYFGQISIWTGSFTSEYRVKI